MPTRHSATCLSAVVEASTVVTDAMTALDEAGIPLAQLALGQPTLDEVFLALTGHTAEAAEDTAAEKEGATA